MDKFKFRSKSYLLSIIDFNIRHNIKVDSIYQKVDKPDEIPDCCVRNGEYVIRRNCSVRADYVYYEPEKQWYCVDFNKKSLEPYYRAEWELFPRIDDAVYEKMLTLPIQYLSKEWQINVRAYSIHKEHLKARRDGKLTRFKIIGK